MYGIALQAIQEVTGTRIFEKIGNLFFMFLREDNEMFLCCNKIHENVQMNAKINFFALLIYFAPAETWHGDINVNFIVNLRMI